ncbi:tRNA pseudouridine(13) synthase TruD [Methanobrevibacter filiformis]|uniref:Probable tRNA pseudouridine synthase D n=1 Tax=Methanobrevibacter filiformis TaxID=55758 RepID=A0A166C3E6_9EURY|nr:tRNA pseudouridine(13) synthase TruD [Methanobrevibacter filiformis]KZX10977.1 tRNA pseudouridine synthase D [Methanobrevibacter filiformis]
MLNAQTYVTKEKGIGGTIRNSYEDFYVEEIPSESIEFGEGPNIWIWIEKVGRTTLDVLMDISRDLHISRKRMGFAGMKDKRAVTRQWICISNIDSDEQLDQILALKDRIRNTEFLKVERARKKLRMGQLIGNKFKILIRDIEDIDSGVEIANNVFKTLERTGVPNYFGWQRFGKPRTNTHKIGKALVENDIKEAVRLYIGNPYSGENEEVQIARAAYDTGDIEKTYELMPNGMRYERIMLRELLSQLKKRELDEISYMKSIYALPKPLQRMFVNAYQSYLFNKAVSNRIKLGIDKYVDGDIVIDKEEHWIHDKTPEELQIMIDNFEASPTSPLFGTKVPLGEGKVGELEQKVLDDEGLKKEDFECPKTPKLGSHGIRRAMRFKLWDAKATATDEGILTEFSITKGSYATSVLREVMKNEVV